MGPPGEVRPGSYSIAGLADSRMIETARQGKVVVRLKGGDPLIFGRGGEEAEALRSAGVAYEIVPGVTAAGAAGAFLEISLTHSRDLAMASVVGERALTELEDTPRRGESALALIRDEGLR